MSTEAFEALGCAGVSEGVPRHRALAGRAMNGTAFDTLAAANALRDAGFEDRQAEALAGS